MTVKELIEILATHPPEMRVIVSGYEDGYNDLSTVAVVKIRLDCHKQHYYYGAHQKTSDQDVAAVSALWFAGYNPHAEDYHLQ